MNIHFYVIQKITGIISIKGHDKCLYIRVKYGWILFVKLGSVKKGNLYQCKDIYLARGNNEH